MATIITHPFKSGNSQAIRLPKDFAYPENTQLILNKENNIITLTPVTTLERLPALFGKLGESLGDDLHNFERDELLDNERAWE